MYKAPLEHTYEVHCPYCHGYHIYEAGEVVKWYSCPVFGYPDHLPWVGCRERPNATFALHPEVDSSQRIID